MNPHLVPAASYQSLDPDPLAVTEDELVERRYDLNAAIRRARPSVDSPLADWMLGRITREEMDRRFADRDAREAAGRLTPTPVVPSQAAHFSLSLILAITASYLAGALFRSIEAAMVGVIVGLWLRDAEAGLRRLVGRFM